MSRRRSAPGWWMIGNCQYGMHIAWARSAVEAKAEVRDRIAETYLGEGLSPSASRRAASSYRVFLVAGPLDEDVARAAQRAWDAHDSGPVRRLAAKHRGYRARAFLKEAS